MKKCSACLLNLPKSDFGKLSRATDGLQGKCKKCLRRYQEGVRLRLRSRSNSQAEMDSIRIHPKGIKFCSGCENEKPLSEFSKSLNTYSGLNSHCKDCDKDYRVSNSKGISQKRKGYYQSNKESYAARRRKRRALQFGALVPGAYEPKAAELAEFYGSACLYPQCESKTSTIDHVIPLSKGGRHALWNFQPLCRSHNTSKYNTSFEDYRPDRKWVWRRPDGSDVVCSLDPEAIIMYDKKYKRVN